MKYFRQSMESLGQQTYQDFEVIIIDDGSYDGTEKMIDIYTQQPNVESIAHERNQGIVESLNDGLVLASGEYIAIQHADDISLPQRLEKQVAYLDKRPNKDLVSAWIQYIDAKGKLKKKDGWWLRQVKKVYDDAEGIRQKLLEINCIAHSSVMFRKDILGKVGFYDGTMFPAEDYDYWLRISDEHNIGIIREVLCHYRQHHQQLTNTEKTAFIQEKARLAVKKAKQRRGL